MFCFYVHWPRGHPGGLPDVCSVYMGMQERGKGNEGGAGRGGGFGGVWKTINKICTLVK